MNETNTSSGLTQQVQNLTINDFDLRFRVPIHTTALYFDKKENLFKIVVPHHQSNKTQKPYEDWGPNFDQRVCYRPIWVNSHFNGQLSTSKKIRHNIARRIDKLISAGLEQEV